jgi:hypothetical protein
MSFASHQDKFLKRRLENLKEKFPDKVFCLSEKTHPCNCCEDDDPDHQKLFFPCWPWCNPKVWDEINK